jgi:hypothetical protein
MKKKKNTKPKNVGVCIVDDFVIGNIEKMFGVKAVPHAELPDYVKDMLKEMEDKDMLKEMEDQEKEGS